MKLWILSNQNDDRGVLDRVPPPEFDVFVCAGHGDTTGPRAGIHKVVRDAVAGRDRKRARAAARRPAKLLGRTSSSVAEGKGA